MNTTNEAYTNLTEQLLAQLRLLSIPEEYAADQSQVLSEVILLTTVKRLIANSTHDISVINQLDSPQKLLFLQQNFTTEEIVATLERTSADIISEYFTAISSSD